MRQDNRQNGAVLDPVLGIRLTGSPKTAAFVSGLHRTAVESAADEVGGSHLSLSLGSEGRVLVPRIRYWVPFHG